MASLQQPEVRIFNLTVQPDGTAAAQASRWGGPPSKLAKAAMIVLASYLVFFLICLNAIIFQSFGDCGYMVCPCPSALPSTSGNTTNVIMSMAPASTSNSTPSSMNNATTAVAPRGLAATDRRPFTLPVDDTPLKGQSHVTARALEAHADHHNDTVLNPSTVPDPGLDHRRQSNLKPRGPADIPYNPPSKGNIVVLPGNGLRTDYIPPRFRKTPFARAHNTTNTPALAPNSTHVTPTHNTTLINHPAPTNTTATKPYPALPPNTPFRRLFPAAPLPDSDSSLDQPQQRQTFLLPPLSPDGPPRYVNQAGEPVPIPLAVFMMWRKHRGFEGVLFDEVVPERTV